MTQPAENYIRNNQKEISEMHFTGHNLPQNVVLLVFFEKSQYRQFCIANFSIKIAPPEKMEYTIMQRTKMQKTVHSNFRFSEFCPREFSSKPNVTQLNSKQLALRLDKVGSWNIPPPHHSTKNLSATSRLKFGIYTHQTNLIKITQLA